MSVLVRAAGFLTSVQDLGRTRLRHAGVSVGGALDSHALRVANLLVGNDGNAAGLELTFGRSRFQFQDERFIAWCGGRYSIRLGERDLPAGHVALAERKTELNIIAPKDGGRAWLAISGGVDVPIVLGSRSTDLRGHFGGYGGRALHDGDELPLGSPRGGRLNEGGGLESAAPWVSQWSAPASWTTIAPRNPILRFVRGLDWKCFTSEAQRALASGVYKVLPDSDRMGARLEGPKLERIEPGDLLSEAVTPGTVQVPPNGQPILLLGGCQTIGGYPKIAHVITVDLPIAAQLWPGNAVRFAEVTLDDAQLLLREREEDFSRFQIGLQLQRKE